MRSGVNPLTANVVLILADFLHSYMMTPIKKIPGETKLRIIAFGYISTK